MGLFKKGSELIEKAGEAVEKLAKHQDRVEPEIGAIDVAADAVKTAKPNHLDAPELDFKKQEAKGAEEVTLAKSAARTDMNSVLGDLHPPLVKKEELGTHLKELEATLKKHDLIDGTLVSNRSIKDVESALEKGEHISPNELKSFKTSKIKEFDDYADSQVKNAIRHEKEIARAKNPTGVLGTLTKWGSGAVLAIGVTSGTAALINPDNPNTFSRLAMTASYKWLGNDKKGDDYAEFLLSRYESFSTKNTGILGYHLFKPLDPYKDLKEYFGLEKKDLEGFDALSEESKIDKQLNILHKLSTPKKLGEANISADKKIALTMFVTKNLPIQEVLGTQEEILAKIKTLEEKRKEGATEANDRIKEDLKKGETEMYKGWGEESLENPANKEKAGTTPSLSEAFDTAHNIFENITQDDTHGVKGKLEAIDQSWKLAIKENTLDVVEFQKQLKEHGINEKAVPAIVDYAKMAIQP